MLLDTHAAVFLHAGQLGLFGQSARYFLEREELWISPMVLLELECLRETGRIRYGGEEILADLRRDLGLRILDRRWEDVARKALELHWTKNPFDRLIVA